MAIPAVDLSAIRLKTRRITKSPSVSQITDAEVDDYINTFYLYDFPEHLRLFNLKQTYNIITQPDIDIYNFTPNTIVSIEPPVYVGGFEIQFMLSRNQFFNIYPEFQRIQTLTTGTGIAGPYAGTITGTPVKRNRVLLSTVDINGNALSAQDTTAGTFTGNVVAGSTINYTTGAIAALTWTSIVPAGTLIRVQSINYQSARPQAALFYEDTIQLFPVPDQAYEIVFDAYVTPTALVNPTDEPQLREWWQLLAYGASMKIFEDSLDMESFQKAQGLFEMQLALVERRTYQQLTPARVTTIYQNDLFFPIPFSSGS